MSFSFRANWMIVWMLIGSAIEKKYEPKTATRRRQLAKYLQNA